jgi:2,4-dienoyl-CoA reductase-like NADH-dependent reductase (Old Yellow Enzyme family)
MSAAPRSPLFEPLRIRGLTLKNRVVVAPMGMYSAVDGLASDWHLSHIAKFAVGGAGLVFVEATAVTDQGRGTYGDLGLWNDTQVEAFKSITRLARGEGAASAIQLAHAGRKASMQRPWHGNGPLNEADSARGETPWDIIGPTDEPVGDGWLVPHALTLAEIDAVIDAFAAAARRALAAGFDVVEIHCAHGYLNHSFLSPLANKRTDAYGGDLAGRMRFSLAIAERVRAVWPADRPLFYRISSVDGVRVGWSLDDSVAFAKELKARGVDVIDCSSGGMSLPKTNQLVAREPGFQVPFAARIRREANVMSMAVGLIYEPRQAEAIVRDGAADLVALARELLHNPHWSLHAARALGVDPDWQLWPECYGWWLRRRDRRSAPAEAVAS